MKKKTTNINEERDYRRGNVRCHQSYQEEHGL